MARATTTQAEYWNGEVGQRWARSQGVLDAAFAPLTEALFTAAALAPGAAVLDIGCGSGATALRAAQAVGPRGHVVAADLSQPLLAVARARRPGAEAAPVAWTEADAETHDFGAARFDRAISRFGVMFFADPVAAFANLRRALRPNGRLTVLCWQAMAENPWVALPRAAVLPLVPEVPPSEPDAPGPFRFADHEALCRLLRQAGFQAVACEAVRADIVLGTADDGTAEGAAQAAADFVVELGPVSRLVRACEPAVQVAARAAVVAALRPCARDGAVRLGAACWLVSAR